MPLNVNCHRLIARPPGLPGYKPIRWCAFYGKTSTSKPSSNCSTPDCPNVAHTSCLGFNTEFDCIEVGRMTKGIPYPVVYQESATDPPLEGIEIRDPTTAYEYEDLLELEPRDLVNIIRNLRVQLACKTT